MPPSPPRWGAMVGKWHGGADVPSSSTLEDLVLPVFEAMIDDGIVQIHTKSLLS